MYCVLITKVRLFRIQGREPGAIGARDSMSENVSTKFVGNDVYNPLPKTQIWHFHWPFGELHNL